MDLTAVARGRWVRPRPPVPDSRPGQHLREAFGWIDQGAGLERAEIATACERVIGPIRSECLDWLIPMSEGHLRSILKAWVEHYNRGRPHSNLGPGVPDPPQELALIRKSESRHRLVAGARVLAKSVLAGLRHEYLLATAPTSA